MGPPVQVSSSFNWGFVFGVLLPLFTLTAYLIPFVGKQLAILSKAVCQY